MYFKCIQWEEFYTFSFHFSVDCYSWQNGERCSHQIVSQNRKYITEFYEILKKNIIWREFFTFHDNTRIHYFAVFAIAYNCYTIWYKKVTYNTNTNDNNNNFYHTYRIVHQRFPFAFNPENWMLTWLLFEQQRYCIVRNFISF